jgi:Restriction endonuclease
MPLIFDHTPSDWHELELLVEQAFGEMGYLAVRQSIIETVRGRVAIDVSSRRFSSSIPTLVLCECKHWNSAVPQSVVHSFRSICSDAGAHFGLIISKKGFQSGALKSRDRTNIHLLDFTQFQETFFNEWSSGVFLLLNSMRDDLLPIIRSKVGIEENGTDTVDQASVNNYELEKKYSLFFGFDSIYSPFFGGGIALPASIYDPRGDPTEINRVNITSHRQFLNIASEGHKQMLKFFGLKSKYIKSHGSFVTLSKDIISRG